MSKSEHKNEWWFGAFVFLGIVVLIISIMLMSGDRMLFVKQVTLFVEFRHAQGLAPGSIVSLSGLTIGNVREVRLAENRNVVIAELRIEEKYLTRLTSDSIVSVKTQGALGDKFIFIDPGPSKGQPLMAGATLRSEFQPDLIDLITARTNDMGSAVDVIHELNQLLRALNSNGRTASLMDNLVGASDNLNGLTKDPELRESLHHLKNILAKVDRGDGTLGALINDSTLHERLIEILGDSPRNTFLKPLIRESIKDLDSIK